MKILIPDPTKSRRLILEPMENTLIPIPRALIPDPRLWSLIPPFFRPLIPDPIYLVTTLNWYSTTVYDLMWNTSRGNSRFSQLSYVNIIGWIHYKKTGIILGYFQQIELVEFSVWQAKCGNIQLFQFYNQFCTSTISSIFNFQRVVLYSTDYLIFNYVSNIQLFIPHSTVHVTHSVNYPWAPNTSGQLSTTLSVTETWLHLSRPL